MDDSTRFLLVVLGAPTLIILFICAFSQLLSEKHAPRIVRTARGLALALVVFLFVRLFSSMSREQLVGVLFILPTVGLVLFGLFVAAVTIVSACLWLLIWWLYSALYKERLAAQAKRRLAIVVLVVVWVGMFFLAQHGASFMEERHGISAVKGTIGFCDAKGVETIEPRFDWAFSFSEGLAAVGRGGYWHPRSFILYGTEWGYINRSGELVIPYRFEEVGSFHEGLAWVVDGRKAGFINPKGKFVIRRKFEIVSDFHDGLAIANGEGKWCSTDKGYSDFYCENWGYIDRTGKFVIPPEFRDATDFCNGFAWVKDDEGWLIIDTTGRPIFRAKRTPKTFSLFHEGLAAIIEEGKVGYINEQGRFAIPAGFDEGAQFSEGLAAVRVGETWGYVDHQGEFVIPARFKLAGRFCGGLAPVWGEQRRVGFVDVQGEYIVEPTFDNVLFSIQDGWWVLLNRRLGHTDGRGAFEEIALEISEFLAQKGPCSRFLGGPRYGVYLSHFRYPHHFLDQLNSRPFQSAVADKPKWWLIDEEVEPSISSDEVMPISTRCYHTRVPGSFEGLS